MTTRILILDADPCVLAEWQESLEARSLWVTTASDLTQGKEILQRQFFHLVVLPLSPNEGTGLLTDWKKQRPETSFIVCSPNKDSNHIVHCMRAGAAHYFVKSEWKDSLLPCVQEIISRLKAEDQEEDLELCARFPPLIGRHSSILNIFKVISKIHSSDANVLITGESGTGKELVARAIHCLGNRQKFPWVAVNCGAIPAPLLESELFGHVKGAFTGAVSNRQGRFQLAGRGTLFLDEISDLNFDLQAKLLRAIQNKTFEQVGNPQSLTLNARIIAATNQDLEVSVSEKKFREDLFYRLNVLPIKMPALRTRKSDIPLLVNAFLTRFAQINGRDIPGISEEAMTVLMEYQWPGNVRELENLIERVVVLKEKDGIVELSDFPVGYFRSIRLDRFVANVSVPDEGLDFNHAVNEFENELILQALRKTEGNKNKAANLLQLNRTTLVEKLKRKGLHIE